MTRPASASSAARRGRTRNVTSRPACSILPPKYPPMAPAPTTRMRIAEFLFVLVVCLIPARAQLRSSLEERRLRRVSKDEKRIVASWFETAQAPPHHEDRHRALPLFTEGADFQLKGPGAAGLLVKLPIRGCDRRRRHQQIRIVERFLAPELLAAFAHPGGIDAGIDDQMGDVDVLRSEFARHRLRHRAQSEFGAGEGRKAAAAAQGGGGAGKEDVALAPRQHQPRRFATGDKAGPAGHFPHLAEHAVGGLQYGKVDIGADVENADFQRRMLVGVIQERRDLVLLASVERARDYRAVSGLDFPDQRLELGAVASSGEYDESFGGEFLRDLGTDIIAGADHRDGCISVFHSEALHGLTAIVPSLRANGSRECAPDDRLREAIQRFLESRLDCFVAEFIIGPADGRTRWLLAMTCHPPATSSSTSRNCSLPKNISLPTKKVGEPKAPRSTAACVFSISFALTSGSCARANSFAASRPEAVNALIATSGSSIFFGSTHM